MLETGGPGSNPPRRGGEAAVTSTPVLRGSEMGKGNGDI